MPYTADFETTTDNADCRVWAWAVCEIGNTDNILFGKDIASFIEYTRKNPDIYYFHNLKFDGEFIIYYLLKNGYTHVCNNIRANEFTTLISHQGQFYEITICFESQKKRKKRIAIFKDSLKKLPMTVDAVARSFNLPIQKLELDYNTPRPIGHELTEGERAYIANDVKIMAMALDVQFGQGLKRMTIGADALSSFKEIAPHWSTLFPVLPLDVDSEIRRAYRGGWTYVNPRFQSVGKNEGKTQGAGIVLDVNSLYPSVMYDRWLPIGEPVLFDGQYNDDPIMPRYIQFLTCYFKLKPGFLPTIQLKGSPFHVPTEYITDSDCMVDLALTDVDLRLFFEHYDVVVHSYNGGFKFRQARGMFCAYIDHWMTVKKNSTGGKRLLAKLMLNSLYGKFATNPDVTPKLPYLKGDDSVAYRSGAQDYRDPIYTPVGCYITAYAREVTIRAAQANYDRFMYADTDSLHLIGIDTPDLDIHPTRLGAWSEECQFSRAKYLRAKTYMEQVTHIGTADASGDMYMQATDPFIDVKCAGMPDTLKKHVTFNNFRRGLSLPGKLAPKHVPGGIVLESRNFTLK